MNKIIMCLAVVISGSASAASLLEGPFVEKVIFEGLSVGDGLVANQGASVPCGIVVANYPNHLGREVMLTGRGHRIGFLVDSLNMWDKIENVARARPLGEVTIHQRDYGFGRTLIRFLGSSRSEVWIDYAAEDNPRSIYGGQRNVFMIEFNGSVIVRYEMRSYPGPNDVRPEVWDTNYQVYPSRLQRDGNGRLFYMGFRCQNAVTS
jgi:hypothetical protein